MEDPKIANKDYRLQAITTLLEGFTNPSSGIVHKAGAEAVLSGLVKYDKDHILSFGLPNMTALFLDEAYKAWMQSQQLLQKEQFLGSPSKNMPKGTINPKNTVNKQGQPRTTVNKKTETAASQARQARLEQESKNPSAEDVCLAAHSQIRGNNWRRKSG